MVLTRNTQSQAKTGVWVDFAKVKKGMGKPGPNAKTTKLEKKNNAMGKKIEQLEKQKHNKAAPKSQAKKSQVAKVGKNADPMLSAMLAQRIWDPSVKRSTYHTALSVGRVTHVPLTCKFDVILPMSTYDAATAGQYKYDTMIVMCPNNSPQPGYIWRKRTDAHSGTESISVDPVFYANMLNDTGYVTYNKITPTPGSGGKMMYGLGSGNVPTELRTVRSSLHVQNGSNYTKRFGNVYVRRFATPLLEHQLAASDTNEGSLALPMTWPGLNARTFDETVNDLLRLDDITQRYHADDLVVNSGLSCIPLDQTDYQRFRLTGGTDWPNCPIVGNGNYQDCVNGYFVNSVLDAQGNPVAGASNCFADNFNELRLPTMSTVIIYLQNVPDADQKYSFEFYADVQARFKPGLLNAQAESPPTAAQTLLNHDRDVAEAAGSHLTACNSTIGKYH